MIVLKAPAPLPVQRINGVLHKSVFLAGSIEMGKAEDWQTRVTNEVDEVADYVLNPRRDDWDSTWSEEIANPQFNEQVSWELTSQDVADVIFMYFDKDSTSPISLLELGLYAASGKMIVVCPDGFYRKGNVEITCQRYSIPLFNSIEEAIPSLKQRLGYDISDIRSKINSIFNKDR